MDEPRLQAPNINFYKHLLCNLLCAAHTNSIISFDNHAKQPAY